MRDHFGEAPDIGRYIGSVADDNNSSDPALAHDAYKGIDYFSAHLPAINYIDLAGTYAITQAVELRAGINNITDKNPPVIAVTIQPGGANAYSAYDQLGREVFVSFTAKF